MASDYIHPYKDAGGIRARCRVRIYLPDDVGDAPVVICPEVPNNPGGSITNSAEDIAAGVIRARACLVNRSSFRRLLGWRHWAKEGDRPIAVPKLPCCA